MIWERQVLEQGVRWQVRNGKSILCKLDRWIPKSFPNAPRVKAQHDLSIHWVADLMHESRLTWDTAKLRNVFEEEEVQRILAIPILMIRNFDKLS